MKKLLREWLGFNLVFNMAQLNRESIEVLSEGLSALEGDFNSRDTCKVCGKHRYNSPNCLKPQQANFRGA